MYIKYENKQKEWHPATKPILQTIFKPLLFGGEGGENLLGEVTVNSKEENFCPNYAKEYGLIRHRNSVYRTSPVDLFYIVI
jgi:hypothetical protein